MPKDKADKAIETLSELQAPAQDVNAIHFNINPVKIKMNPFDIHLKRELSFSPEILSSLVSRNACAVSFEPIYSDKYPTLREDLAKLIAPSPYHPGEPGKNNGFVFFKPEAYSHKMPAVDPQENNPAP